MPVSYIDCPICGKQVALSDALSPFCSQRCRLLDLGNWASGRYAIPAAFSENVPAEDDDSALGHRENND